MELWPFLMLVIACFLNFRGLSLLRFLMVYTTYSEILFVSLLCNYTQVHFTESPMRCLRFLSCTCERTSSISPKATGKRVRSNYSLIICSREILKLFLISNGL